MKNCFKNDLPVCFWFIWSFFPSVFSSKTCLSLLNQGLYKSVYGLKDKRYLFCHYQLNQSFFLCNKNIVGLFGCNQSLIQKLTRSLPNQHTQIKERSRNFTAAAFSCGSTTLYIFKGFGTLKVIIFCLFWLKNKTTQKLLVANKKLSGERKMWAKGNKRLRKANGGTTSTLQKSKVPCIKSSCSYNGTSV